MGGHGSRTGRGRGSDFLDFIKRNARWLNLARKCSAQCKRLSSNVYCEFKVEGVGVSCKVQVVRRRV